MKQRAINAKSSLRIAEIKMVWNDRKMQKTDRRVAITDSIVVI